MLASERGRDQTPKDTIHSSGREPCKKRPPEGGLLAVSGSSNATRDLGADTDKAGTIGMRRSMLPDAWLNSTTSVITEFERALMSASEGGERMNPFVRSRIACADLFAVQIRNNILEGGDRLLDRGDLP